MNTVVRKSDVARRSDTVADEVLGAKLGEPLRIPYSKIDPNPDQPRDPAHIDPERIKLLSLDIEENTQSTPVVVFKRPEPEHKGRFMLVGGECRWQSIGLICRRQKKDLDVLAFIVSIKDAKHLFERSFLDNMGRENYSILEEASGFARLHKENGWSLERIAVVAQKSVAWVEDRIQINTLPKEVKDLMHLPPKEGGLPTGTAITLAYMPQSKNADKIEIARESVARGLSNIEAQFLIQVKTGVTYARQAKRSGNSVRRNQYRIFSTFLATTKERSEWVARFGNLDALYAESDEAARRKGNDARLLREIIEQLVKTYLAVNVEPEKLMTALSKLIAEQEKKAKKK